MIFYHFSGGNLSESRMSTRQKINLERVMASLATPCTQCGYRIPPAELPRISTTRIRCPKCGVTLITGATA